MEYAHIFATRRGVPLESCEKAKSRPDCAYMAHMARGAASMAASQRLHERLAIGRLLLSAAEAQSRGGLSDHGVWAWTSRHARELVDCQHNL